MALNIKDPVTERLAAEVAALTSDTKTGAIRTALEQRLQRLTEEAGRTDRSRRVRAFLADEAWPQVPADVLGSPWSKADRERVLGLGPEGV